jgi:hypothetical protein
MDTTSEYDGSSDMDDFYTSQQFLDHVKNTEREYWIPRDASQNWDSWEPAVESEPEARREDVEQSMTPDTSQPLATAQEPEATADEFVYGAYENGPEQDYPNIGDFSDPTRLNTEVLSAYFESLQREMKGDRCPDVYRQKTFWKMPPDPYFILKDAKLFDLAPLYYPRVFIWAPHHLLHDGENLVCPHLDCNGLLKAKSWNNEPYARRVVDIDR